MPHLDFTQPPFDVLSLDERQSIRKNTQIRYLAKGEHLSAEDRQYLYVVIKGQIEQLLDGEFVASYLGSNHADDVSNNDWFDSRRLPESISSNDGQDSSAASVYQFRANEETLLLQVAGSAVDKISAQNHLVRQMLSDKLPERLQALRRRRQGNQLKGLAGYTNQQEVQQIMLQPVTAVRLLPVHMVDASQSLYTAAHLMTQAGLKHVLVRPMTHSDHLPVITHNRQQLIGILTDTDICRAVSEQKDPATTPCQHYTNFNLHTIKANDEIGDALITMTRHRIHRLPVIDHSGEVLGVLGQSDMLAHIGHHSQLISIQIEQAEDLSSLHAAVDLIGHYIRAQHQNGVKIGNISRMVQTLNAQVFTKLWQLIIPDEVMTNTCLIVMGSEGRGEQIMRTDQDNALIIRDGFTHPALPQLADTFNHYLAKLGYPLCDGNIMMTNPIWRQPLSSFMKQIGSWFHNTEAVHGIYLSAILDSEYVCGDASLLTQVRQHLNRARVQADPMFVRQFARAALQFGDVNQWWQKFVPLLGGKSSSPDVDLKKSGIFPLVHGIRTLALENHILDMPSTRDRLKALVHARVLTQERADTLLEALEFFMAQRLSVALSTDDKHARQVNPMALTALERDLLKECLAVVKSFKNQLRQHYQLEIA